MKMRLKAHGLLFVFYGLISPNWANVFGSLLAQSHRRFKRSDQVCKGNEKISYYFIKRPSSVPLDYTRHVIDNANTKGALCIDGTEAVYYLRKTKFTTGLGKWMIVLPGGAWCSSNETCFWRANTALGSSKYAPPELSKLEGVFSSEPLKNPHFYDWNVLYLQYCDGSSFLGNADQPVFYNNTRLYFRGRRILSAFLDEVIVKYFNNTCALQKILVMGYSAGGLAVMTNAHFISHRLSTLNIPVHYASDGGFFVNVLCSDFSRVFHQWMEQLYTYHHVSGELDPSCLQSQPVKWRWRCLTPEVLLHFTTVNLTIVNSLQDGWQLIYFKGGQCGYSPQSCSNQDIRKASQLRTSTLHAIQPLLHKPNINFFFFSCIKHCTVFYNKSWNGVLIVSKEKLQDFMYESVNGKRHSYIDKDTHFVCKL